MRHRSRQHRSRGADGFTLVEMMIAVTLVAMTALALWGVLRISIASWKRGTESIDANQRHRTTMDLVQKQMASLYPLIPPMNIQTGGGIFPVFSGSELSLQFISLSALRFRDNPGMTMVSYEILQDDEGTYSLVEKESRYLLQDPSQEFSFTGFDEPATTIFDHLASASFEYYDPGTNEIPPQWVKTWNVKDTGRLPAAISMSVAIRAANGPPQSRQMIVPVLAKPYDSRVNFVDPFEDQRRRLSGYDIRTVRR
jgi:prepilin-type N-terminal cleavage/methylation domain-containing protein